jgi:outer membrane protein TolC
MPWIRCGSPLLVLLPAIGMVGCSTIPPHQAKRDARLYTESAVRSEQIDINMSLPEEVLHGGTAAAVLDDMKQGQLGAQELPTQLELSQAIALTLSQSGIVRVESGGDVTASDATAFDVQAAVADVDAATADFDAVFESRLFGGQFEKPPNAFFGPGLAQPLLRNEAIWNAGVSKKLETGGRFRVGFTPQPSYLFFPGDDTSGFNPRYKGEVELGLIQPLMRGASRAVNLAPIQITQTRLDQSRWSFKQAAMASVRSTVNAYWDLYVAQSAVRYWEAIVPQVQEVVRIQEQSFRAKWVIEADVAKARTELYSLRQRLVELQTQVVTREIRLRSLLGAPNTATGMVIPITPPLEKYPDTRPEEALETAFCYHPDLVRRRLDLRIRRLEQSVAENNRLPNFDVTALYRANGLGETLGNSLSQLATNEFSDWELGLVYSVPIGRRQQSARVRSIERTLVRDGALLRQELLTISYRIKEITQQMQLVEQGKREASSRLQEAEKWVQGAQLRYRNAGPDDTSASSFLQNLNEYLRALETRVEAAIDRTRFIAQYNQLATELEEAKGTILESYGVAFTDDPCQQGPTLSPQGAALPALNDPKADPAPSPEFCSDVSRDMPAVNNPVSAPAPTQEPRFNVPTDTPAVNDPVSAPGPTQEPHSNVSTEAPAVNAPVSAPPSATRVLIRGVTPVPMESQPELGAQGAEKSAVQQRT